MQRAMSSPAVFKDAFYFVLVSPPPGGSGGGSGLSFSSGDRGFWADSGPDPVGNLFLIFILALMLTSTALYVLTFNVFPTAPIRGHVGSSLMFPRSQRHKRSRMVAEPR